MRELNVTQGSPEWLAARAKCFTASEAPAMMGVSKYKTRVALIREKATGIVPEVDSGTQARFDAGHAAEALARPLAEEIIGASLYQIVATDDTGKYLASSDGIASNDGAISWLPFGFEHKLLNATLAAAVDAGIVPDSHKWQLVHQAMVFGLKRILFCVSDGTRANFHHCWFEASEDDIKQLVAGWDQFAVDVANYQHIDEAPKPLGAAPEMLPALRIQVTGAVTYSNLAEFKQHAMSVIGEIKTDLQSDQDFADAEKTVKWLKDVEDKLAAAKAGALAQTESIDALFSAIDEIVSHAASTRLNLDKQVKREKENRKLEIVTLAQQDLNAFVAEINVRLAGYLPAQTGNFGEAIRGLKTIASMKDKVSAELARCKVAASETASRIDANIRLLDSDSKRGLFPDLKAVCTKAADDFAALLSSRMAEHERRQEVERERIRQEEAAKAAVQIPAPAPVPVSAPVAEAIHAVTKATEIAQALVPIESGATIKLGEISARLGFTVTADFLATIGYVAHSEKNAKLYRASDFRGICQALILHIGNVASHREAA